MTSSSPLRTADAPIFADREEAGRRLAEALAGSGIRDGIVVGLARGGVVPAAIAAEELGLPLDVLAVRKVGHPLEPEYAIGAVTPGGDLFLRDVGELPGEAVTAAVAAARRQADELDRRLHAAHGPLDPTGKTVVLADDGLATGATMTAAVRWARHAGAARVVVTVPIGPGETVAALEAEADEVFCLVQPPFFGAVGFWYELFGQVADEQVVALLDAARRREVSVKEGRPAPVESEQS
jgi:putative phosphoribosyl transferase